MWANFFSCYLWWLLAGVLLGWLCNWLLCKCCGHSRAETQTMPVPVAAPAAKLAVVPAAVAATVAAVAAPVADPVIDVAAALAAGIKVKGADDLEIIEGIGPKICALFHAAGFKTFMQVSKMSIPQMSAILDAAGPNFRLANPESWAKQADLAAHNHWAALKSLQDTLTAGVNMTADKA